MQAEVTLGMFTELGDAVQLLVDRGQQRVDYTNWRAAVTTLFWLNIPQ